jgi:hypothetical protein
MSHVRRNPGHPQLQKKLDNEVYAQEIYDLVGKHASRSRVLLQMLVGLVIVVLILCSAGSVLLKIAANLDLLNSLDADQVQKDKGLELFEFAHKKLLSLIGYGLVVSAGIDLAYMLFTPDLDEAVEPLIVALSAGSIIVLSGDTIMNNWSASLALVVMVASIAGLFWVKHTYIPTKRARNFDSVE